MVDVYAASSLTDAFGAVEEAFEASHPEYDVRLNLAGSSALQRQILDGADADVFAPADVALLTPFLDDGQTPRPYATNTLALIVPATDSPAVATAADLGQPGVLLARCAPGVPCGDAADRFLTQTGITPDRATEESNVRTVLTKVALGEVDAGLVYTTDALARDDVRVLRLDDPPQVVYATVALTNTPGAVAFDAFVHSPAAAEIMAERGFGLP